MASYAYTARDKAGAIKKGSVFGNDRQTAAASLMEKGLVPILLKEEGAAAASGLKFDLGRLLKGKVKLQEKVVFSRQFATMINAGVPIVQALSILGEQTPSKTMKNVITELAKKVEGGATLASALAEHPTVFSPVYINMVKAGETGGILDQVLERLATQQEKDSEIVSKVRGAMIYPSVITVVTVGAFFFLMTVIVPKMGVIFEQFGTQLPAYTRVMLAISKGLTHYGLFIAIGGAAAVVALVRYHKTRRGKKVFDTIILRTPIFGAIVRKVNIARFARTFGSLMTSGIAVLDALNTTALALGNSVYRDELLQIAQDVKNGKTISAPLRASKNFPPIVSQMVLVGEETGQLDEILVKLAEFYEREVDAVVSNLTSIIEPLLIIIIGGMIGAIVIGILGPLGSLTNSI
ncbi:MAG TPA: type II secretion system F family protein [Candidatus Nanoarchaeia archaeon]|nr:type II secretion system F family protein [Candidatus Nanoarchaeia archaeon]